MCGFCESAMDCCDPVNETSPGECLFTRYVEHHIFLESFSFPSLSKLMEATRTNDESIRRTSTRGVERYDSMQLEGAPDLYKMAQQVQNLFKFRKFYDQIDFSPEWRLTIMKPSSSSLTT